MPPRIARMKEAGPMDEAQAAFPDSQIVAQENIFDQMTLMSQIGALPPS